MVRTRNFFFAAFLLLTSCGNGIHSFSYNGAIDDNAKNGSGSQTAGSLQKPINSPSPTPPPSSSPSAPPFQAGLKINATFDSTITNDPNALQIEATINSVIAEYEAHFANPITVNITFKEITSVLGVNEWSYFIFPYATFRSKLANTATTANDFAALAQLPNTTNEPVLGHSTMMITLANYKAINPGYTNFNTDGTVGINVSQCNLDRTNINPALYDLASVTAHKINEILGLYSTLGLSGATNFIFPLDLFRYDQNGNRSHSVSSAAQAYFSIDGITNLIQFNQSTGADYGNWANSATPHVQDVYGTPGVTIDPNIEFTALDVIGYEYVP